MSAKANGVAFEDVSDLASLPALPTGWSWTTLESVADIAGGITKDQKRKATATTREVPYLRVANVQRGYLDLNEIKTILADSCDLESLRLQKGDILFTEGGDRDKLGRGWIWNDEIPDCIHQNHIFRARLKSKDIEPKFVSFHGNTFGQEWFTKTGKQTTNLASINKSVLRRFPVPIAPAAEQRRIVAKIEELFSDLDAGVAALERARANLKRYRASVLKAAVEGELTADWRARHPPAEPASALLQRILKERRAKWEADQLAKFAAAGKTPPKDWQQKYVEPTPPDTTGLRELPEGWCWATVEQVTENFDGRRIPVKNEDRAKRQGEFPYYGASGIIDSVDDFLFDGHYLLLAEDGANLLSRSTPIAFEADGRFWVNNHAHILRTFGAIPLAYLRHFFNGTRLDFSITGTAQPKLTQAAMNRVPVPLPSLQEQHIIADEVDERLSQIDAAEIAIEHGLQRAARLRQSILKQAFEGKLVPQDPADEPASVLLERIAEAKAGETVKAKHGRGKAGAKGEKQ